MLYLICLAPWDEQLHPKEAENLEVCFGHQHCWSDEHRMTKSTCTHLYRTEIYIIDIQNFNIKVLKLGHQRSVHLWSKVWVGPFWKCLPEEAFHISHTSALMLCFLLHSGFLLTGLSDRPDRHSGKSTAPAGGADAPSPSFCYCEGLCIMTLWKQTCMSLQHNYIRISRSTQYHNSAESPVLQWDLLKHVQWPTHQTESHWDGQSDLQNSPTDFVGQTEILWWRRCLCLDCRSG